MVVKYGLQLSNTRGDHQWWNWSQWNSWF